jgi:regulator of cell morphogenesis and NO signaling
MKEFNTINHKLIDHEDKLCEVIGLNIDLLPIVFRFGISSNIGQESIHNICLKNGLDTDFFLSVLNTYHNSEYFPNTDTINLSLLTDFLIKTHQYHELVTIPLLERLMQNLKEKLPEKKLVITLEKYLNEFIDKLKVHIEFEEEHIFPLVDKLNSEEGAIDAKTSGKHLKKLFSQHANVETEISDLIIIIIQHIPAQADVQLFHEVLHTLSHFEKEQIDHARFEDKILVPRLIQSYQLKFTDHAI